MTLQISNDIIDITTSILLKLRAIGETRRKGSLGITRTLCTTNSVKAFPDTPLVLRCELDSYCASILNQVFNMFRTRNRDKVCSLY